VKRCGNEASKIFSKHHGVDISTTRDAQPPNGGTREKRQVVEDRVKRIGTRRELEVWDERKFGKGTEGYFKVMGTLRGRMTLGSQGEEK